MKLTRWERAKELIYNSYDIYPTYDQLRVKRSTREERVTLRRKRQKMESAIRKEGFDGALSYWVTDLDMDYNVLSKRQKQDILRLLGIGVELLEMGIARVYPLKGYTQLECDRYMFNIDSVIDYYEEGVRNVCLI